MNEPFSYFVTCPKGTEGLLADEIREIGAEDVIAGQAGVSLTGDLELGYRICLWSRVASRVLLFFTRFEAKTPEVLYDEIRSFPWEDHMAPKSTLAVDFLSVRSEISHGRFGALKVKDAIVDRFRDQTGVRPDVDPDNPDIQVNVYLYRDEARVSLDLSGESLHRRGYRRSEVAAPLKENLAAAILIRARWPEVAQSGGPLLDLMCGSGTLAIEAALMAGDVAPGLLRPNFGSQGWRGHHKPTWQELRREAEVRKSEGTGQIPIIIGYDQDPEAVQFANSHAEQAGISRSIRFETRELREVEGMESEEPGLVVVNPPYGKRMGGDSDLTYLYARMGDLFRDHFPGWRTAVFTGNPALAPNIRLKPRRSYDLLNGAIPCKLLVYKLATEEVIRKKGLRAEPVTEAYPEERSQTSEIFANRLRKNLRHLGKWARRSGITCYRIYDSDLPDYPMAIDVYGGRQKNVHVQIFEKDSDLAKMESLPGEVNAILPGLLEISVERVYLKTRKRQKGDAQYGRMGKGGKLHQVQEGDCKFLVNFTDHLDTGIFLDHRITRQKLGEKARGKRFLNLFGYTGTATVYAAVGGAVSTTTVDLSGPYLAWARKNLELNGFQEEGHEMVQDDCVAWLLAAVKKKTRYGLIFLDPPTFSNSKSMSGTLDVQRDHADLISQALGLLDPDGILLFSTNRRNFKMEYKAGEGIEMTDITKVTIPQDFARHQNVHRCWEFVLTDEESKTA
jgi:23S rRNA (guanine2445-N2)-methyltransferase / 23S rRNA (guanine2069-N7)-methyltransferase